MASPENTMDCEELAGLTAPGLDTLDEVTRARCDEHAKTCEECRRHMAGVEAFYDALANPGKYPRSKPEILEKILQRGREPSAQEATGPRGPRIFPILFLVLLGGAAVFYVHQATRPRAQLAPIEFPVTGTKDQIVPLGGPVDAYFDWLKKADDLIKDGHPEEARVWLQKVLDNKYAPRETKAEARKKLEAIEKK
jgi:hypothetical protein